MGRKTILIHLKMYHLREKLKKKPPLDQFSGLRIKNRKEKHYVFIMDFIHCVPLIDFLVTSPTQ